MCVSYMDYEKMWNELQRKLKIECTKVNGVNGPTNSDHVKFCALYSIVKIMDDLENEFDNVR